MMTLSEFTNGIPLPLCLYAAAGKAAEQGKQSLSLELVVLSELCTTSEYVETEAWLRAHKHCGACRGPLYESVKKPELEFAINPATGFAAQVTCGPCADAKRSLLIFQEFLDAEREVELDILPPQEFATVSRFLKSKRFCDECGAQLGEESHHMAVVGAKGITCYSICGGCNALWESEAMLPNLLRELQ